MQFKTFPISREGSDEMKAFTDNPAIKVRQVLYHPTWQDPVSGNCSLHPALCIVYDNLADPDYIQRMQEYESVTLKRYARLSQEVESRMGYPGIKSQDRKILFAQAVFNLSKSEAEIVVNFTYPEMREARDHLLKQDGGGS